MKQFDISVQFDDATGVAAVSCTGLGEAFSAEAGDGVELYKLLLKLASLMTRQLPPRFGVRHQRGAEIEALRGVLSSAHAARLQMEAGGWGDLNALDPMPHIPAMVRDPAAGCAAYARLVHELMVANGSLGDGLAFTIAVADEPLACGGCREAIEVGHHFMRVRVVLATVMPPDWQPTVEAEPVTLAAVVHNPACFRQWCRKRPEIVDAFA